MHIPTSPLSLPLRHAFLNRLPQTTPPFSFAAWRLALSSSVHSDFVRKHCEQTLSTIARLQMSKGEIREIGDGFEEPSVFYAKGITLSGDKFMVTKAVWFRHAAGSVKHVKHDCCSV